MRHLILDQWSRRDSFIHRRDARSKIVVLLSFLIVLATTPPYDFVALSFDVVLLLTGLLAARLPLMSVLSRASTVLPFCVALAAFSWLAGDIPRAVGVVEKTYLSALATLLLVSTTPASALFHALERLHTPRLLVTVLQMIYRYLFVISEQAQRMRTAALARSGNLGSFRVAFRLASGSVAVLFARSYLRAAHIQRAIAARGFAGRWPTPLSTPFRASDALFSVVTCAACILIRLR